jgi:hypothetical protein
MNSLQPWWRAKAKAMAEAMPVKHFAGMTNDSSKSG